MRWTENVYDTLEQISCIDKEKQIYSIKISPTQYGIVGEDFDIRYVDIRYEGLPTTYAIKNMLIDVQNWYDKSDEVNSFIINGKKAWLDKSTRLGLINSLNVQKSIGQTSTYLWLNGDKYSINIDYLLYFLKQLELYAVACYNISQTHLAEIDALTKRDAFLTYDVTRGYPEMIEFDSKEIINS